MSDKLKFGMRVRSGVELVRRTGKREPKPGQSPLHKFWATEKIVDTNYPHQPRTQREGIIIGKRTLSNGGIEYDYDAGTLFFPEEHFTAYVVAYAMNRKPFLVKREDLTVLDEIEMPK